MKIQRIQKIVLFVGVITLFVACGGNQMPKPYGYFRVDLPTHRYRTFDTLDLPCRFDLPTNAKVIKRQDKAGEYWFDIHYRWLNASIYCSYKPVKGNLMDLLEDTRKIVYKHSVKADGIGEKVYENKDRNVHGILYDLKGNTASSVQFTLTDSTRHFLHGSLYFNNVPNKDSIAPMSKYIREDILRLMESFEWK
jgi:gliding motility-associated lipoprotein GldD